jgi:hypothetical protein
LAILKNFSSSPLGLLMLSLVFVLPNNYFLT